jgi:hemoglobin-like flavoprotein
MFMINEDQQVIVRNTFTTIAARSNETAQLFYERVFEIDPSLRPLFRVEMKSQQHHFMLAISALVTSLSAPELIKPILQQIGKRHRNYGVQLEHYPIMKRALLDTLSRVLEDDYTYDAEEAWSLVYDSLVDIFTENTYA